MRNMALLKLSSVIVVALAIAGFTLFLSAASPALRQQADREGSSQIVLRLDPGQSKVHWTLGSTLHTVHGTFALKWGSIHFDPETGKAGGEIVVNAASGQSGNDARDTRMKKEILETAQYSDIVFRPIQVEGTVDQSAASDLKLRGILSIHGVDHDLTALVHAELMGDHWKATGKFEVPYVMWGIKDPSVFLLKVKPFVDVELEASGGEGM